jgi:type IX secretion system PorP/SprF family membrane protein
MKKRTVYIAICVCFFAVVSAPAQDLHFSQYLEAPMMLNPALTSAYHAFRGSINYREQWKSVTVPYKTAGASFEMKLNKTAWNKERSKRVEVYHKALKRICAGLMFFNDNAGDGNMHLLEIHASLASSVPLNDMNTLGAGLQGGYVQNSIGYSKLLWPDQFNGTAYDPSLSPGENYSAQKYGYADFSAGLVWNHGYDQSDMSAQKNFKWTIGAALFHINRPKHGFYEGLNSRAYEKTVVHARFEFGNTQKNIAFLPAFMCAWQGPSRELLVGGMLRYRMKDETKYTGYVKGAYFSLGAHYRNKDAIIANSLLEFGNYAIGFSYDINVSDLDSVSRYRGGFEIMIRYSGAKPFLYQNKTGG